MNRPTLGLLIGSITGWYHQNLWTCLDEATKARDVNLIGIAGGRIGRSDKFRWQSNALYDRVSAREIDGLLIPAAITLPDGDSEQLGEFCRRFDPVPIVVIGARVPGLPSVMVDSVRGMSEQLAHLIEEHGCRRIAFIRGPEGVVEAQQRYQAYADTLAAHGISLDPHLIAPGVFSRSSGTAAVEQLLDERGMSFDALVAANDEMAVAAIQALQARGVHVPGDVAVAGFDDSEQARSGDVSLTTVAQPLTQLAREAVGVLLAQMSGQEVPEQTMVPTTLIVRRSCGCPSPVSSQSRDKESERAPPPLMQASRPIMGASNLDDLIDTLGNILPGLGISNCYLALYEHPVKEHAPVSPTRRTVPTRRAELVLAYETGRRIELTTEQQDPYHDHLLPAGLPAHQQRFCLLAQSLYVEEERFGFILLQVGQIKGWQCHALASYISAAVRAIHILASEKRSRAMAEKADQLKTRLLANVSHELRSPLDIVLTYTHMLEEKLGLDQDLVGADVLDDLDRIRHSVEHQRRLIDDLLDLSRAEIDELNLQPVLIDTRSFLEDVFHASSDSLAANDRIAWRLSLPDRLPQIEADPTRLRQILLNLLSNAAKFTDRGEVVLGAEVSPPHLHIWVQDTGIGISPELQEQIFEPFVTADDPSRRQGIGLGLSITRRLAALHGGNLYVDSQPGVGSTFHVHLPLPSLGGEISTPLAAAAQPVLFCISGRKEETPALSREIAALSQRQGLEVRFLDVETDIERMLRQAHPAAIAWDLGTAGPDDWATIERLKKYSQLSQLPFILYGGGQGQADRTGVGPTGVMVKPCEGRVLLDVIEGLRPARANGVILIVDDDPTDLEAHRRVVESGLPGYGTRVTLDGAAALALMSESVPSLVVLDLNMPEMDGFQVLEWMRANEPTRQVPVLIFTGRTLTLDDVKRLERHAHVTLQSKDLLSEDETVVSLHQALFNSDALPLHTSALAKRAVAYLQQHYQQSLSRQEVAAAVGVSERYLSRIFRQELGLSPWDYLNRYRVLRAKELLRHTHETVTAVGYQVGFSNPSYFGRVFRRLTGCSPSAYRDQSR